MLRVRARRQIERDRDYTVAGHLPAECGVGPERKARDLGAQQLIDLARRGGELRAVEPDVLGLDRKSTRLNSSHKSQSRMPSSA